MRSRNLRILGLSLLALVGVMAVSASAAQAEWLLLRNQTSVLQLNLVGEVLLGELLVGEPFNLAIHCTGGTASAVVATSTNHLTATVSGSTTFTGCRLLDEIGEACEVGSPGDPNEVILAEGEGSGEMSESRTYSLLEPLGGTFAAIEFRGEFCPLDTFVAEIEGSAWLEVLNPATEQAVHLVTLDDDELVFAGVPAFIDGQLLGETRDDAVLIHMEELEGAEWGIDLVNL